MYMIRKTVKYYRVPCRVFDADQERLRSIDVAVFNVTPDRRKAFLEAVEHSIPDECRLIEMDTPVLVAEVRDMAPETFLRFSEKVKV